MTIGKSYYVYIVECSDGTYYTGLSNDVEKRIRRHNGLLCGGAKYTSTRRPVKIIALSIPLENRSQATKLEYKVKKKKRANKVKFLLNYGKY